MSDGTFRIAIRAEGNFVNAYLAPMGSMDGAELVASIDRRFCDLDPEIFDLFKAAMQRVPAVVCKLIGHQIDAVEVRDAPAHERAGHA